MVSTRHTKRGQWDCRIRSVLDLEEESLPTQHAWDCQKEPRLSKNNQTIRERQKMQHDVFCAEILGVKSCVLIRELQLRQTVGSDLQHIMLWIRIDNQHAPRRIFAPHLLPQAHHVVLHQWFPFEGFGLSQGFIQKQMCAKNIRACHDPTTSVLKIKVGKPEKCSVAWHPSRHIHILLVDLLKGHLFKRSPLPTAFWKWTPRIVLYQGPQLGAFGELTA